MMIFGLQYGLNNFIKPCVSAQLDPNFDANCAMFPASSTKSIPFVAF